MYVQREREREIYLFMYMFIRTPAQPQWMDAEKDLGGSTSFV